MSRKKGRTKTPIGITIDTELLKKFDAYKDEYASTRSKLIEKLIQQFLKEKKK